LVASRLYDLGVLYGRDAERDLIGSLLDGARESRSGVLVVRGEAGIGKTALLEDARDRAGDMQILSVRGVEYESELPFAGLHQFLRPALHLLDGLPPAQGRALSGALGLSDRAGDERFLISAACLTLLSDLAERRPVLCLVDDAQWLDTPSADALLFVARRLDAEGIVLLAAVREGYALRFEGRQVPMLDLGALAPDAAAAVVDRRVEGLLDPAVRDHLVTEAAGNALALVELPGALTTSQLAGEEPLPAVVPLSHDLERLFLGRVRVLPEPTQRLLTVIAADNTGRVGTVLDAAASLGIPVDALDAAERAGLVSVHGSTVGMRHPLIRSAVYQASSSFERRNVHLALARALGDDLDPDRRAWHRAAAAIEPDAEVADELERTAERARLRSGHGAASAALERSGELSVDPPSRARRLVAAATEAWHAGQPRRASTLLDTAKVPGADWRLSAEVRHLRGVIQLRCGVLVDACDTLMAGAEEVAPHDPRKALEMLLEAREAAGWAGDTPRTVEADRRAAALTPGDDCESRFLADLLVGVGSVYEGEASAGTELLHRALKQADGFDEPTWLAWAAMGARAVGDEDREAALMRRAISLARASGAVDKLTYVLLAYVLAELLAARLDAAADAAEGLTLAREAGLTNAASTHLAMLAWFAGARGSEEECRSSAAEARLLAHPHGASFATSIAEWGIGLLELSRGRPDEAVARLSVPKDGRPGVGHPYFALMSAPDLVEAHVRAGRKELAREAFAPFAGFAEAGAPAWARAIAARCVALLQDGDDGAADFEEALRLHDQADRPFDRARSALLYGEQLRRQRRRVEARVQLRRALEAFEELGATTWAERARSELRASGETARKRDPSTVSQLTPQEVQVARFVAEGLSNKEVAAQLFLSPRTIDAHLRNVFGKLGLTSRTQLAPFLLGAQSQSVEARAPA
jgi:DNA-binding CsgD family transcriptional regulator/tetratricopeptide (TPR) repeat protein